MKQRTYMVIDYVKGEVVEKDLSIVEVKDFLKKTDVLWHLTVVPSGYSVDQTIDQQKKRRL